MFPKMGSYSPFFSAASSTSSLSRASQSAKDGERYAYLRGRETRGSVRRANQARTHTADSETKQFLFQPRCAPFYSLSSLSSWLPTNVPACLPAAFTCHPPPFASNRRARWNFSGREREKGIFLEITTEALQEEHPASKRMRQRKGEGNRVRKEENEESERETSEETGQPARKRDARH